MTPKTVHGKVTTIFYAIFGIPLSISMYTRASEMVNAIVRNLIKLLEMKLLKRQHVKYLHAKTLTISIVLFLAFFFSLVYFNTLHDHGNLTLIDSTYYWFQTLTTIGYGDVYPMSDHNDVTETILRISFMFGLGMMASLISSISKFFHEINKKKVTKLLSFHKRSWTLEHQIQEETF